VVQVQVHVEVDVQVQINVQIKVKVEVRSGFIKPSRLGVISGMVLFVFSSSEHTGRMLVSLVQEMSSSRAIAMMSCLKPYLCC
jgi:hypothetical protein